MPPREPNLLVSTITLALAVAVSQPPNARTFAAHGVWSSRQESSQAVGATNEPVSLWVTVRAKDGQLVKDLGKEEFRILENGKERQIVSFSRGQPQPLILGLLMQWSGQLRDTLPDDIDSVGQYFQSLMSDNDAAFAAKFSGSVELVSDFANDSAEIDRNIRRAAAAAPYGPAALFDALIWACRDKLSSRNGHRILVLVADGRDNASKKQLGDAVESALRAETVIYVVSLARANPHMSRAEVPRGIELARRLAEETGGEAFIVRNKGDLAEAFSQIAEELRSQYVLGYYPTSFTHDGRFREIRIETTRNGLHLLARRGYYTPKIK